jgi:hypothetical protein
VVIDWVSAYRKSAIVNLPSTRIVAETVGLMVEQSMLPV